MEIGTPDLQEKTEYWESSEFVNINNDGYE